MPLRATCKQLIDELPVLRDTDRAEGMPEGFVVEPPPPLNEASSSYNRAQPIERVAMDEIYRLFSSYDADVDHKITESEFLAGVASLSLPPSCDPAAAFALLDVDGSGTLSLNELCIAIGPDLLAAKAQGVTATACLSKVIAKLTAPDATNIAAPTPMENAKNAGAATHVMPAPHPGLLHVMPVRSALVRRGLYERQALRPLLCD